MKTTKLLLGIATVSLLAFGTTSCKKKGCDDPAATNYDEKAKKNDGSCIYPEESTVLSGNITENTTLTADKIWTLDGRVTVTSGTTLTIEAGTIIKAESGTGSDASTLIIARGGKIDAQGTATAPIIFTSISDDIQLGETAGSSLTVDVRGLWGGVLILGNAPCSFSGDVSELQIEGIPASDANGLYGGSDAADNSGTFKYVSIRHGGAEIGEGNEINGLTLGGVGTGTTIDHVEVVGNVDDGIEFFGGTVNASNLVVWGQGDDAIDVDQAYSGTIDNVVVVQTSAGDHGFEIDGPEGSAAGSCTIQNATIYGATDECSAEGVNGEIADFRDGIKGTFKNVAVIGFASGKDVELDDTGVADNYTAGTLKFEKWEVVVPKDADGTTDCYTADLATIFVDKSSTSTFSTDASTFGSVKASATVGATTSVFSWTYSKTKGAF